MLTLTTVARLNLWGLLYLLAIGHVALRVGYRRDASAEASAWGRAGALIAIAIVAQYAAALSMPPSVWPDPRRPWAMWADGYAPAAHACERLGSTARASGLVCWMSIDGGTPITNVRLDLASLATCLLAALALGAPRAAPSREPSPSATERPQPPTASRTASRTAASRARAATWRVISTWRLWTLRLGHVAVLVALLCVSTAANVDAAHGLVGIGYVAISLAALAGEAALVRRRSAWWRFLHVYAWAVLLLILLMQARIRSHTRPDPSEIRPRSRRPARPCPIAGAASPRHVHRADAAH